MGNEVSKPQGAADVDETSRSREGTPPIGTGRYADDGNIKEEATGTGAGPASSLDVERPTSTKFELIDDGPPAQLRRSGPLSPRPPPASDPEFRNALPTLSSPNRVRPPSQPPATEPLPLQLSLLPTSPPGIGPSTKPNKAEKSRKSKGSTTSPDDPTNSVPANPASTGTPDRTGLVQTAKSPLAKAERKALRKALRKARKEAREVALAAGGLLEEMDEHDSSVLSTQPSTRAFLHSDSTPQSMPPPHLVSAIPSTPTPPQTNNSLDGQATLNGLEFSGNGDHSLDQTGFAKDGSMASSLGQQTPDMGPLRKRKASGGSGKEKRRKKSKRHESPIKPEAPVEAMYASQSIELDNEMTDAPHQQEQQILSLNTAQEDAYHGLHLTTGASNHISELSNGAIQAMVAGSQVGPDLALDPSLAALDSNRYDQQNGQGAAEGLDENATMVLQQQGTEEVTFQNRNLTPGPDAFSAENNMGQQNYLMDGGLQQGQRIDLHELIQPEETPQVNEQENVTQTTGAQATPETPFPVSQSVGRRKSKISYLDRQPVDTGAVMSEFPGQDAASPAVRNRAEHASRRRPRTKADVGEGPSTSNRGSVEKKPKSQKEWAKGALTAEENAKIQSAVEEFRSEQGMSQFEVNEMIHEDPSRKGTERHRLLWDKVHASLPRRPPRIINYRTRKLFHNFVGRQVFTKEEDEELRRLVELKGPRWSEIGALINRSPLDIRDRWRNYTVCGDRKKADFWSQDEEARLVEFVVEAIDNIKQSRLHGSQSGGIEEAVERDVSWERISQEMDRTRSAKQCREKWALLRDHQRVAIDGIHQNGGDRITEVLEKTRTDLRKMAPEDKLQLIEAVRKTTVELDDNIVWSKLGSTKFRKQWNRNTLRVMWARLRKTIEGQESMSTLAVADALIDQYKKDNVLVELGDSDVDNEAEVSLLDVGPSARKTYRTPRVAVPKNQFEALKASGTDPSAVTPAKSKRKAKVTKAAATGDVAKDGQICAEVANNGGTEGGTGQSYVPADKRPRNRKSTDGAQSNARRSSASTRPETPGKYKSAQFVAIDEDEEDDSGYQPHRSASPEVPASPDRAQLQLTGETMSGLVADSQINTGDSQEDAYEDRMDIESVDLAEPDRSKSLSRVGSPILDAEVVETEADRVETVTPRAGSAVPYVSSVFAVGKFKKRKSASTVTPSTLKKTSKPRTPFSGSRSKASLSVYDDIESAHGESSQPNPVDVNALGIMSTQDEEAHQRQMELAGDNMPSQSAEYEESNSDAERKRLAQFSDEDSDMEDIPAELPKPVTFRQ